jgi:hypothetical protein
MELRKGLRYRLEAPACFSWECADQRRFQGEGVTRDISLHGAFIVTTTNPPVGSFIKLELLLPPISGMNAILRITGTVKVVRYEHPCGEKGVTGFAVLSDEQHQWGLTAIQSRSGFGSVLESSVALKAEMN